ncbi:MAG TPA: hypothetical protein VN930_09670 [Xanthobacteraceae bacterium]|nr:hypothetical protein [Xanthobacteraceae bacterium]
MGNDLLGFFAPLADLRGVVRWLIIGGIALGLWIALKRTALDPRARTVTWLAVVLPLLAWHLVVWRFAAAGGFETRMNLGGVIVTAIPLAILLPPLIALPFVLRSVRIGAALDALSPPLLVGFQVYRVLGSVFLLRWFAGELPGVFALPAGTGDVLVGVLALPVALYLQSGARGGRAAAYAWNILGIVDLLVAISIGTMTQPGRLNLIPVEVANTVGTTYPLVMIPAFAVPLSLILHALSLRQLVRSARRRIPAVA